MGDNDVQNVKRCVAIILKQFDFHKKELNPKWLHELKDVVRRNDGIISEFVDYIFENLRREDSDVRLCLVLLVDYFFQRSHKFRVEIIDHLQDFLIYTIETDPLHYPLPRPPEAANMLKSQSIKLIRLWIEKFSSGYPKLKNVDQFLSTSKSFDFTRANAELLVERQRAFEEQERKARESRKIVEKVQKLYEDNLEDMKKCITEAKTAIELVFPRFEEETNEGSSNEASAILTNQLHGITPQSTSITVVLPTQGVNIQETEDNADLFNALKDITKLMEFHLKNVNKWLQKLSGAENSTDLLKKLINLKLGLNVEIQRCKELGVKKTGRKRKSTEDESESSDDDDDEFIDVQKEGLELDFNQNEDEPIPQHILDRITELESHADKPGPSGIQPQSKSAEKRSPKKPAIPTLNYGLDLKYWGQKVDPAEIPKNQYEEHRFWRPPDQDEQITEAEEVYKSRSITFVNEMPAIKRRCRAPLPSGKLCPRMDRSKCPIHGDIVDRDEMGFPIKEQTSDPKNTLQSESERLQKQQEKEEAEYLRDVEKQTGRTLTIQNNRSRTQKREKSEAVKTRERLSTKLFDRRALKRVSDTLMAIQKQRAEKRFSHQFNYVVTNKK